MAKGGGKKPKKAKLSAALPEKKAVPQFAIAPQHEGRHLSWSFSAVDNAGPWPWSGLLAARHAQVIKKLGSFETMDLHSLKNFRSIHPVSSLSKEAKARLLDIRRDDLERLIAFHTTGVERVWCADYDSIMFVLWWDPHHTVYQVGKKHT